jgi:hypothetical protein
VHQEDIRTKPVPEQLLRKFRNNWIYSISSFEARLHGKFYQPFLLLGEAR